MLRNIALIDEIDIPFTRGLNILTGETGAGKTAILSALGLLLGERADHKIVRNGASQATVQALFSIDKKPRVQTLLREHGIEPEESLTLRREIFASGKSQLFIADRLATLQFAKKLGAELIEIISQHSHLKILSKQEQLKSLDLFGEIDTTLFTQTFAQEKNLEKELQTLLHEQTEASYKLEKLKWELQKIEEIDPKENEDEELFEEYKGLNEKQELAQTLTPLSELLSDTLLPNLSKQRDLPEEISPHLQAAERELLDAAFQTSLLLSKLEFDPIRFDQIEKRLTELGEAKKCYGDDLCAHAEKVRREVEELSSLEETIFQKEEELDSAQKQTDKLAKILSEKRSRAAALLASTLTTLLQTLNMAGAEVEIHLEKAERSTTGDEKAHFTLKANPGERAIRLEEGVSGGEISRLYFSLKTLLSKKEQLPTLLFDEIDANIGGETATLFGEKLQQLSEKEQIIAITHFPQVARFANHHLKIAKSTRQGRTHTQITPLASDERNQELLRMLGGQELK